MRIHAAHTLFGRKHVSFTRVFFFYIIYQRIHFYLFTVSEENQNWLAEPLSSTSICGPDVARRDRGERGTGQKGPAHVRPLVCDLHWAQVMCEGNAANYLCVSRFRLLTSRNARSVRASITMKNNAHSHMHTHTCGQCKCSSAWTYRKCWPIRLSIIHLAPRYIVCVLSHQLVKRISALLYISL